MLPPTVYLMNEPRRDVDNVPRYDGELFGTQGHQSGPVQNMPDLFPMGIGRPFCHLSGGKLQFREAEMFDSMLFGYHQMSHGHAVDIVYGFGMGAVIEVRLPIR